MRLATAALSLLITCSVGAADNAAPECSGADAEALQWLEKMSRSHQELPYHGVVTFQRGDDLQFLQVSRAVHDGHSDERLTRLTGQGARITRLDHPQDCLHPGHNLLRPASDAEGGVCGLARHYRFQLDQGERIAGRGTVRLRVQPRDMYRYGHILELDRETGLLLRSLTLGRDERVLERMQFAELTLGKPDESSVSIELEHNARHPAVDQPEQTTVGLPWQVNWLPEGFTRTDAADAVHPRRTYTDGLAVFSVFLEPLGTAIKPGEGLVREGSTASYTRGMVLAEQPVLVTVIGEVPVNTARMVADAVRLEP